MILLFNLECNFNCIGRISVTQAEVYAVNYEKLVSSLAMANN